MSTSLYQLLTLTMNQCMEPFGSDALKGTLTDQGLKLFRIVKISKFLKNFFKN